MALGARSVVSVLIPPTYSHQPTEIGEGGAAADFVPSLG
jgi:hypothetical protein